MSRQAPFRSVPKQKTKQPVINERKKNSLVKLTLPGYNNFSLSLSVVFEGGDPTWGVADDNDAFTGSGLDGLVATTSSDEERLCVIGLGSNGVVALPISVIASNYSRKRQYYQMYQITVRRRNLGLHRLLRNLHDLELC